MKTTLCLVILSITANHASSADYVVSPIPMQASQTVGPFLLDTRSAPSSRWQQVYGSTEFNSFGTPLSITEISFATFSGSLPINLNLHNVEIRFTTTANSAATLSQTFADNIGAPELTVYSGSLHFFDTGTEQYGIHIQLQHPFVYSPTAGNLLLDVLNYETISPPQGGAYAIAGQYSFFDSTANVSQTVSSPAGGYSTGGMMTRFTVTAVPEPGMTALLFVAAAVALTHRSGFRRGASRGRREAR